jgi:hypothetical protein
MYHKVEFSSTNTILMLLDYHGLRIVELTFLSFIEVDLFFKLFFSESFEKSYRQLGQFIAFLHQSFKHYT